MRLWTPNLQMRVWLNMADESLIRLLLIVLGAISLSKVCSADEPKPVQRPNVVVIVADDLGWSDLGCYGADLHETPNLNRLASQSVRFTDAYAASICSPTRACLLTGKHYVRLGMTIWREGALSTPHDKMLIPPPSIADLPYREVTLAEVFHAAGYLTAMVGKWHLGDARHYPETQGFDINIGGTLWGAPPTYFFPYLGTGREEGNFRYVPHLEGGKAGEYLTDRLTDEAIKVIDRAGDQPFFLYLAHHAVHTPIEAKQPMMEKYQKKMRPGMHHQNAKYAAMVESLDESVGRVLERLERDGLAERTIVLFVSDNGGYTVKYKDHQVTDNFPLRSGKGSLYEGGVRVPMIVRAPGHTAAGGVCHEPVYVGDVFPTLVELAGVPDNQDHGELDGVSLASLVEKPSAKLNREALYFHYPHYYPTTTPASAIRAGDWKLLEYYEDNHAELYNLHDDLSEAHDLAAKQPEKVKELRAKLEEWKRDVKAKLPKANPEFKAALESGK